MTLRQEFEQSDSCDEFCHKLDWNNELGCYKDGKTQHEYQLWYDGYQVCAERKDKHKQEILGALLIGLDAAKEVAANYHQAMAGYRENKHKMLDDDVICIERAIAFLTGETE